jgi:hypothetical protein
VQIEKILLELGDGVINFEVFSDVMSGNYGVEAAPETRISIPQDQYTPSTATNVARLTD